MCLQSDALGRKQIQINEKPKCQWKFFFELFINRRIIKIIFTANLFPVSLKFDYFRFLKIKLQLKKYNANFSVSSVVK